ncbi:hypothetical protein Hanom_Chr17g01561971 [Helianthus anomalus]
MNTIKRMQHLFVFVHLINQTKFFVHVHLFIKRMNVNEFLVEGFMNGLLSIWFVYNPKCI